MPFQNSVQCFPAKHPAPHPPDLETHLCIPSLLMSNKHARHPIDTPNSSYDCFVIVSCPIPVQLNKLVGDVHHNVHTRRPIRMPGNLQSLIGCQLAVSLPSQLHYPLTPFQSHKCQTCFARSSRTCICSDTSTPFSSATLRTYPCNP